MDSYFSPKYFAISNYIPIMNLDLKVYKYFSHGFFFPQDQLIQIRAPTSQLCLNLSILMCLGCNVCLIYFDLSD